MAMKMCKEKYGANIQIDMEYELDNLSRNDIAKIAEMLGFRKLGELEAMQAQLTARGGAKKFIDNAK